MHDRLIAKLQRYEAEAQRLKGWKLSYEPEPLAPGPPWDYEARARQLVVGASAVMDLGTGGGEVFSRILDSATCRAVAVEWWHVNAPVAARRLGSRAPVVRASSLELPFADDAFDLILSRHEEIRPEEIARVLAPGGRFLTQQVIPDLWHELREVFPEMTRFPNHFAEYQEGFRQAGLAVKEAREFRRAVRFRKLGHLVYHLVAAPWTIPGFTVESHIEGLARLEDQAREADGLVLTEGFYLLEIGD